LEMSFELELLDAEVATWDEAQRAVDATATPAHVRVRLGRRKTRLGRERKPTIGLDYHDAQRVLDDQAGWDEDAFTFSEYGRQALAATVKTLGEVLRPGWTLRSYWVGDPVHAERLVSTAELGSLIEQSEMRRDTLYRTV
jgi:hypothetical protein